VNDKAIQSPLGEGKKNVRGWSARGALYDSSMTNKMEEPPKGPPVSLDDAHKHRLEFAAKMEGNWHALMLDRTDERAWRKLTPEVLEAMHTKIAGLIQECERELIARPSPEGRETIVDRWKEGLTRKNEEIKVVIDQKRAVT